MGNIQPLVTLSPKNKEYLKALSYLHLHRFGLRRRSQRRTGRRSRPTVGGASSVGLLEQIRMIDL